MSRLQAHPVYEVTGVEWFPSLPVGWSSTKLKYVATCLSGGTPDTAVDDYWLMDDTGIPWVAIGDMSGRQLVSSTSKSLSDDALASKSLPVGEPGMLLFAMYASVGEVTPLGIAAAWNQALLGIKAQPIANTRFIYYALKSVREWLPALYRSNTQNNLNAEQVGNFNISFPPLESQKAIAEYLDRETAQIDDMIIKQQQLIELLAEKRQSIITHAITKGLDPTAPIQPSGIPWLGDIPSQWTLSRLKWTGPYQESGTSVNGIEVPAGPDEVGVLKTGAVSKGYFDAAANKTVVDEDITKVSCPVRAGTLVVNRANTPDLVGSTGVTTENLPRIFLSDKLWQIDFKRAESKFIYWWSKTETYRSQIQFRRVGASSSMQNLSYTDFLTVDIALPTLEEQRDITRYLDDRTAKIDRLKSKAKQTVELLKERRSALISAAVTGEIDVQSKGELS